MPIYTYECPKCGTTEENIVDLHKRDTEKFFCPECGEDMKRIPDAPVIGKPAFQMKAILGSGEKVAGHFGKAAKKK